MLCISLYIWSRKKLILEKVAWTMVKSQLVSLTLFTLSFSCKLINIQTTTTFFATMKSLLMTIGTAHIRAQKRSNFWTLLRILFGSDKLWINNITQLKISLHMRSSLKKLTTAASFSFPTKESITIERLRLYITSSQKWVACKRSFLHFLASSATT